MGIEFWGDDRDALVNQDPLAFLIAMLLDQQIPLSWAFDGPNRIVERTGVELDAATIAASDPDAFATMAAVKPAIHRYHRSMAGRVQALCAHIADEWGNDAARIWNDGATAATVADRLAAVPGFGPEKIKITVAALVKRFRVDLAGWESVASPFDDDQPRSVADIGRPEDFERVKAWKKEQKAAGLDKQDEPL
jgi:uncharacterized HhH-GPD family protein